MVGAKYFATSLPGLPWRHNVGCQVVKCELQRTSCGINHWCKNLLSPIADFRDELARCDRLAKDGKLTNLVRVTTEVNSYDDAKSDYVYFFTAVCHHCRNDLVLQANVILVSVL